MPNTLLDQFNNPNPGPSGSDPLTGLFGYQNVPGNNPNFPSGTPGGYNPPTTVQQLPPGALPVNAIPMPTTIQGLGDLTSQINAMNRAGQTAALNARIPGAAGLEQQSSDLIGSELRGEVPIDVQQQLQNRGAEGATLSGGNASAAYLRALGLTSIDQTQRGEQNLTAADARNPAAPIFDPSTQLLTPAQAGQLALGQGNLTLSQQEATDRANAENNRLRLEAQRLALGQGGGGRGGISGGGGAAPAGGGFGPGVGSAGIGSQAGGVGAGVTSGPIVRPIQTPAQGGGVYTGGPAGQNFFNQLQNVMGPDAGTLSDQDVANFNDQFYNQPTGGTGDYTDLFGAPGMTQTPQNEGDWFSPPTFNYQDPFGLFGGQNTVTQNWGAPVPGGNLTDSSGGIFDQGLSNDEIAAFDDQYYTP